VGEKQKEIIMPKKTYKVGNDIYDIEDSESVSFLKDMPDAVEVKSFIVGKDTFDIGVDEVEDFLKDMPDAKPLNAEKKKFGLEDFNKKYGTSYTEQEFGGVKPSQSKSTLKSSTTTTTTPKNPQSRIKLYSQTATNIQNRIPQLVEAYNQAEANGDAVAMQELEARIKQDSDKIDYFNKAIEGQKQLESTIIFCPYPICLFTASTTTTRRFRSYPFYF